MYVARMLKAWLQVKLCFGQEGSKGSLVTSRLPGAILGWLFQRRLEACTSGRLFFVRTVELGRLGWYMTTSGTLLLCPCDEANLEAFMEDLNQAHPTIKYTAEWSRSSIPFLETHVLLENGKLTTDLHVKPTDTNQYLDANSCHQRHCK